MRSEATFHIPRWKELPDVRLYMDQLITYINSALAVFTEDFGAQPITKNMINNYVKAKIVPAPVKKQYDKYSLAMIIVLYILKGNHSTEEIGRLIAAARQLNENSLSRAYDNFCGTVEDSFTAVFHGRIAAETKNAQEPDAKYLMDNFALSLACKYYVRSYLDRLTDPEAKA